MSETQVDDEFEEEDILIFVEIDGLVATESLDVKATSEPFFKIMGLDTDTPFMQIGTEYFTGEHTEALGSTLFFEADDSHPSGERPAKDDDDIPLLRYFGKTCKHVSMRRAFLHKKNKPEAASIPHPAYLDDELLATLPDDMVSLYLTDKQREDRRNARVAVECAEENQASTDQTASAEKRVSGGGEDEPMPGPSRDLDGSTNIHSEHLTPRSLVGMEGDSATAVVSRLWAEQMNIDSEQ